MFEAFFTDSCLRYRIEVINGIDFYGLGFGMVRGESMGKWISQWMQKGETASVLITNTKLPDTSGFEFAERIRSQCPRVRVIFVTDTPSFAEAQQAVRFGAYAYLLKSDGIEAEVIGAGLVAFDELLLRIGQGVPGGLGRFALGVGLIGAGLDIDRERICREKGRNVCF